MIHILHLPDLHFVKNAASHNFQEVLQNEASEKVRNVPQGEKLLIVTGDFHNLEDADYRDAEQFLQKLASKMGLDIKQDVFLVPGDQDVGADAALEPLLTPEDMNWKYHQASCLELLKTGNKSYVKERIKERLQVFRPYSNLMRQICIYEPSVDEDLPAGSHVRCWRGKLNILHLNTALIAGGMETDRQMADVDTAAAPNTWEPYYDEKIPSIAIGHNSFYDLKEDQRSDLAGTFALRNVSAYLAGDMCCAEQRPEFQMIRMEAGSRQGEEIPNLVADKSVSDNNGALTEYGFCWHQWDETDDKVTVEFHKWSRDALGSTTRTGENGEYTMRHEKRETPDAKDKPVSGMEPAATTDPADSDVELRNYLARVLVNKRNEHPSFKLLDADDIDSRLFPKIKKYKKIESIGKTVGEKTGLNKDSCPVWEIIKESWAVPEHRNVVITGEGGIGKTVALFSIIRDSDRSIPVPTLYIPMYELFDEEDRLIKLNQYIKTKYEEYSEKILHLATEDWNDRPRLLVLLDGFDEITFSLRRRALDMINEWYDSHPGVQIIAVSRTMDGLNLVQELEGNPLPIELTPLEKGFVRSYLEEVNRQRPAKGAPIWDDLKYPLFLNLYVKSRNLTKNLPAGYPLSIMDTDSGGALIWNFLQRELLRHRSDKSEKAENWVLRCAVANEYILPFLAYRMLSEYRTDINYKQAVKWIEEALDQFDDNNLPHHLTKIWNKYEQNHGQVPGKNMFSFEIWRNTVLRDSGILVPLIEQKDDTEEKDGNYIFMHRHFRDCLAGLYLVNQAEMAIDKEMPDIWMQRQNQFVLKYAAELIDDITTDNLWEANRQKMQYKSSGYEKNHSGTITLLELFKLRYNELKGLNFSGMDIQDLNLTRYMDSKEGIMHLFEHPCHLQDTMINRPTFQSEGHFNRVNCVAVLPDNRIVSGSGDHTLRVWDSLTGQYLQSLEGHEEEVKCVAVLRDGKVVSGSVDNTLRVWNPLTGEYIQILEGHTGPINCLSVLPDGKVVSGSSDHTLRVWAPLTGECLQILKGHTGPINCINILPDGSVVSGSGDKTLRVWNPLTGKLIWILKGHSEEVKCVITLSDDKVVSGSGDRTLRVWNLSIGQCVQILEGHEEGVRCLAVQPNGFVISGSEDSTLRVWNVAEGQCIQILRGHNGHNDWVNCVVTLKDGRVISGSGDRTLRVWNPLTGECLQILKGHDNWVNCMAVLSDGSVVSGSGDRSLRIWNPSTGQCLQLLKGHFGRIRCIQTLPNGRVVSGSEDGTLQIWDTLKGRCVQYLEGHNGRVLCIAVLPNGCIVSGSGDNTLRVWDPSTGQCLQVLEGHRDSVRCVAVLRNGNVVSGSDDYSLRVWDPETGQCLRPLIGHYSWIRCLTVLPNDCIVSGSSDNTLQLWNSSTGQGLQTLEEHKSWVNCVAALSEDIVVSGSGDGVLHVWDLSKGESLRQLKGHEGRVLCVAILPNKCIISGSDDNTLRIWDYKTGQCLKILKGHNDWVNCVTVISEDIAVSGSGDNTLRIWNLKKGECINVLESMEVNVSHLDFSRAILLEGLPKLLWQNGATISESDFNKHVRPFIYKGFNND